MKTILKWSICCILILFFGCKKKEKLQSSTWAVNGETFTAVAETSLGKAIAALSSNDVKNRFNIVFYQSYPEHLPREGSWELRNSSLGEQNPNYAYVYFYYNDSAFFYNDYSQKASLTTLPFGEKAHYVLAPTWFFDYYHTDSMIVSGDFYEP